VLSFPPDWTFIAQIVLFLIVWTYLRRLLFEPNLSVLKARKQRTEGAMKESAQVKAEVEELNEQYRARLATTRTEARQKVDTIYKDAGLQARSVVEAARKEAGKSVVSIRQTLSQDVENTRLSLEAQLPQFAREISEKLLERPLSQS
jgi:F0F1-type ATP synthase membrane subunit b/b'